jgi:hypothetical protein
MTSKEKAKELVEKMLGENNHYLNKNIEVDKLIAIQCALICVDEILNVGIYKDFFDYDYWKEVNHEISLL